MPSSPPLHPSYSTSWTAFVQPVPSLYHPPFTLSHSSFCSRLALVNAPSLKHSHHHQQHHQQHHHQHHQHHHYQPQPSSSSSPSSLFSLRASFNNNNNNENNSNPNDDLSKELKKMSDLFNKDMKKVTDVFNSDLKQASDRIKIDIDQSLSSNLQSALDFNKDNKAGAQIAIVVSGVMAGVLVLSLALKLVTSAVLGLLFPLIGIPLLIVGFSVGIPIIIATSALGIAVFVGFTAVVPLLIPTAILFFVAKKFMDTVSPQQVQQPPPPKQQPQSKPNSQKPPSNPTEDELDDIESLRLEMDLRAFDQKLRNSSARPSRVDTWSVDDVKDELLLTGLDEFVPLFEQQHIDGNVALALTEQDIRIEFANQLSLGKRKRLYQFIEYLRKLNSK